MIYNCCSFKQWEARMAMKGSFISDLVRKVKAPEALNRVAFNENGALGMVCETNVNDLLFVHLGVGGTLGDIDRIGSGNELFAFPAMKLSIQSATPFSHRPEELRTGSVAFGASGMALVANAPYGQQKLVVNLFTGGVHPVNEKATYLACLENELTFKDGDSVVMTLLLNSRGDGSGALV